MNRQALPPACLIRRASAQDFPAIVEVWKRSGSDIQVSGREREDAFLRQLARTPDLYLVAVIDDRPVGVVLGSHDGRKGWINRLAVLPEFRRRGIAAALVTACEQAIRGHGIEIICALVEPQNEASAEVFRKLGFNDDFTVRYFRKKGHPGA